MPPLFSSIPNWSESVPLMLYLTAPPPLTVALAVQKVPVLFSSTDEVGFGLAKLTVVLLLPELEDDELLELEDDELLELEEDELEDDELLELEELELLGMTAPVELLEELELDDELLELDEELELLEEELELLGAVAQARGLASPITSK
ncbi:MAG: hypothetical protein RL497_1433 [Pseudomonadota bacterium]